MTNWEELKDEIMLRLGQDMIEVELDTSHIDLGIKKALRRYRQRSGHSLLESFIFVQVQTDTASYKLPQEVQEVRAVLRRDMTATGQAGAAVDPFTLAFTNNVYMLQNPGGTSGAGVLANYDLAMGFQKIAGRMFGRDVMFTFDTSTKQITFHRRFIAGEEFGLHAFITRPDEVLLADPYARPWLDDYSLAQCKMMLGEARSKFASLAGPQGGITMNGDALKNEAQVEMDKLDLELQNNIDGSQPYSFVIG